MFNGIINTIINNVSENTEKMLNEFKNKIGTDHWDLIDNISIKSNLHQNLNEYFYKQEKIFDVQIKTDTTSISYIITKYF